jgi:hypothetical protein
LCTHQQDKTENYQPNNRPGSHCYRSVQLIPAG